LSLAPGLSAIQAVPIQPEAVARMREGGSKREFELMAERVALLEQ